MESPVTGLELRVATVADVDAVLAFWALAAEDRDRPADSAVAIRGLLDRDPEALLLGVIGERVVASLIVGWDGWRAHLYRLAVAPELRRRGVGRWLLSSACTRLQETTAIRVDAMVLDSNAEAWGLWSDAEFRRQGNWSRWVRPL